MLVIRASASIGRLHLQRWTQVQAIRPAAVSGYQSFIASTAQIKRWYSGTEGNQPKIKAVIFDMGGVLISQPAPLFADYEKLKGIPAGLLLDLIRNSTNGAWQRLETGQITAEEFGKEFSKECSEKAGCEFDVSGLLPHLEKNFKPVHEMIDAVQCLKAQGIKTGLLTNNWKPHQTGEMSPEMSLLPIDPEMFNVVTESCQVGMRKPNPGIYEMCVEQLKVKPEECLFLDDIGRNLKGAKEVGIYPIKVDNTSQALNDLSSYFTFPLQGYIEGTTAPRKGLEIPKDSLKSHLKTLGMTPVNDSINIRQFKHGQSNPTYYVGFGDRRLVLRKKPPGKLLPSAHAVEREYLVMNALGKNGVPVPKMVSLCQDTSVVGTPFYLMDHIQGRVFKDPSLPGLAPNERLDIYQAMCDVLCKIHSVDINKAGLQEYGKHGNYVSRQVKTWSKQYKASETHEIAAMSKLMVWLPQNTPEADATTVVHGDFRLDNLIFHPDKPEVLAVLDWELSTLGDPISDLAYCCLVHFLRPDFPILRGISGCNLSEMGIPTMEEFMTQYCKNRGIPLVTNMPFYMAFSLFRVAAILQGVYKRSLQGQASSQNAKAAGLLAEEMAKLGWSFVNSPPPSSAGAGFSRGGRIPPKRNYSVWTSSRRQYSTQVKPGLLTSDVSGLSEKVQKMHKQLEEFMKEHVYPMEAILNEHQNSEQRWSHHPMVDSLKEKAKSEGLWNLFLPLEADPNCQYGAGLTNMEYAHLCEIMGRSIYASEVFNCSAPDTGNMEVLVKYGNIQQKEEWLKPLLNGTIRSCYAMTEPAVASSDATNIQSEIRQEGDTLILNGRKWWISGAMDPRCKLCIFMGKTDPSAQKYTQQSMVIVPMETPGVKVLRPLSVFGYEDPPGGHVEMVFEDVRVPAENIILGPGRGFEIAQGRLGPGRIHHCMRLIGMSERALDLMVHRVQNRVAFGKPLADQGTIQADIAESRMEIEQARLLTLKAAHMMDTVGNKVAAPEIAMIKVAAPNVAQRVIDRAMQAHGGAGLSSDFPLAMFYSWARILRLADGPDEVHRRAIAKMELRKHSIK